MLLPFWGEVRRQPLSVDQFRDLVAPTLITSLAVLARSWPKEDRVEGFRAIRPQVALWSRVSGAWPGTACNTRTAHRRPFNGAPAPARLRRPHQCSTNHSTGQSPGPDPCSLLILHARHPFLCTAVLRPTAGPWSHQDTFWHSLRQVTWLEHHGGAPTCPPRTPGSEQCLATRGVTPTGGYRLHLTHTLPAALRLPLPFLGA